MDSGIRSIAQQARNLALACAALLAANASAQTVLPLGTRLIVQADGPVMAQFIGGASAIFDNELYLDSPANALGLLFQNHTTLPGTTKNLGTFTAGTELIFRNRVVQEADDFFTGPGTRNPDGIAHAQVSEFTNAQIALVEAFRGLPANTLLRGNGTIPVSLVGFEDIFGGGDLDYDDLTYLFNNLGATAPVPEPSQTLLFLVGIGVIGFILKRRAA